MTISRRRSDVEDEAKDDERPRRSRRSHDEEETSRGRSRRSSRSRDEDSGEERRSRRSSSGSSRRSRRGDDEKSSSRRRGTGGFGSYAQKKRSGSGYADEFKPDDNKSVLIKVLDAEPFDSFNQHFINELPKGERKSFCCITGDEYFEVDEGCPLCDIGEGSTTMTLFDVLDLTNPRKPEVKVWKTTPSVTDQLQRMSEEKRTSPLNREDLYFEVKRNKTPNKTTWSILPVKARDLQEDFDIEPFTAEELAEFDDDRHEDRTAVTKVDTYDDLLELADSLD